LLGSRSLAVSDGSLRSLRCSLGSRRLRRIRRNDPLGQPSLLSMRFVCSSCRSAARTSRARITPSSPPTSSSLADDKACPLAPPQHSGGV